MNKKIVYLFALLMVLILSQCGPTTQDALDYNDELIAEELLVIDKLDGLTNALSTYEPENIGPAINAAKDQVDNSIKVLEVLGGFDGNTEFVDACMELFKVFKSQLNDEYAEQFEIYKLPLDQYGKVEEDRYNELNTIIDAEYYPAFEKFSKAQEDFAEKWDFDLAAKEF